MKYTEEYLNDVLVRLAYHSSGIQGNRISFKKAEEIILFDGLLTNKETAHEYYEILNHQAMFTYLTDLLKRNAKLLVNDISEIHSLLTDRLMVSAGQFKDKPNIIGSSQIDTALPKETPIFITQWLDQTFLDMSLAQSEQEIMQAIAFSHYHFERIHPYTHHNGPTGRAIMLFLSMKYLHTPLIITCDDRIVYLDLMEYEKIDELADLFHEMIKAERQRMYQFKGQAEYFANKQKELELL